MKENWETVIGLEIHAQLSTETKIFCGCSARTGCEPNANTCPVCLGLPGALPVLNRRVVEKATRAALSLSLYINEQSIFARKNYFYPDLPKGYQISQYDRPFSERGNLEIMTAARDEAGHARDWRPMAIRITRLHLEEDAGKNVHEGLPETDRYSYVDLNRAGTPLAEIVTEPDFRSSWEAYDYVNHVRRVLQWVGASEADMEKGNLRCEANVSVRRKGEEKFGTKVELKNLNSVRFMQRAIEYEIERQINLIEAGGTVTQETRLWDDRAAETRVMRSKEEAHDYRYFPEPDLQPLVVTREFIENIRASMPELPDARRKRFMEEYELSYEDASLFTSELWIADYYENLVEKVSDPREAANWIKTTVLSQTVQAGSADATARAMSPTVRIGSEQSQVVQPGSAASPARPVNPKAVPIDELVSIVRAVNEGKLNRNQGKEVLKEVVASGKSADTIIVERGLVQVSDTNEIEKIIDDVLSANPQQLNQYRAGKETLFGFFVGQIMKASKGKANPKLANELLKKKLSGQ